jgi:hypothetical protein
MTTRQAKLRDVYCAEYFECGAKTKTKRRAMASRAVELESAKLDGLLRKGVGPWGLGGQAKIWEQRQEVAK